MCAICEGTECDGIVGYDTLDQCIDAHATCDAPLCTATGGRWLPASVSNRSGHDECPPSRVTCESPTDSCDCPAGAEFIAGAGCVVTGDCTWEDLCAQTGGEVVLLGGCDQLSCGDVVTVIKSDEPCLSAFGPACSCGDNETFDPVLGCYQDPLCPDLWGGKSSNPGQPRCEATGGRWTNAGSGCEGGFRCGEPWLVGNCDAEVDACDCGRDMNYDDLRGCVADRLCSYGPERRLGERCENSRVGWTIESPCAWCLRCCDDACVAPVCETGNFDENGCAIDGS